MARESRTVIGFTLGFLALIASLSVFTWRSSQAATETADDACRRVGSIETRVTRNEERILRTRDDIAEIKTMQNELRVDFRKTHEQLRRELGAKMDRLLERMP